MAHRNVGRSIPYLKIEQVGCHRESPDGSFTKNILSLAKPILPDLAYAVITPNCEIGVGIGIQRLRKFLTVNHILTDTDYPDFDSDNRARWPASRAKRFDAQAECNFVRRRSDRRSGESDPGSNYYCNRKRSLIYFLIVEIKAVDPATVARLSGIFAPIQDEIAVGPLEVVQGSIPWELTGVYLRTAWRARVRAGRFGGGLGPGIYIILN